MPVTQRSVSAAVALVRMRIASRTLNPITGREIADLERLPSDYVEQILLRLRRANLVRSTRGARGGYALARTADQISIRDVIEASETMTFDLHCVSHPVGEERCSSSHNCSIRPVWMLLQRKIDDVLGGVCLADLLAEESEVRSRVGLAPAIPEPDARALPVLQS